MTKAFSNSIVERICKQYFVLPEIVGDQVPPQFSIRHTPMKLITFHSHPITSSKMAMLNRHSRVVLGIISMPEGFFCRPDQRVQSLNMGSRDILGDTQYLWHKRYFGGDTQYFLGSGLFWGDIQYLMGSEIFWIISIFLEIEIF
jgi:hypothetical protein